MQPKIASGGLLTKPDIRWNGIPFIIVQCKCRTTHQALVIGQMATFQLQKRFRSSGIEHLDGNRQRIPAPVCRIHQPMVCRRSEQQHCFISAFHPDRTIGHVNAPTCRAYPQPGSILHTDSAFPIIHCTGHHQVIPLPTGTKPLRAIKPGLEFQRSFSVRCQPHYHRLVRVADESLPVESNPILLISHSGNPLHQIQ